MDENHTNSAFANEQLRRRSLITAVRQHAAAKLLMGELPHVSGQVLPVLSPEQIGAMIPLTLKRLGADPVTAPSIFLTTATDVDSMGLFLGPTIVLIRQ